ncbi:MAG TPA: LysM peptidoglycan-binding domain-containing protein [Bacteroidia bacterium]|nr:LysM peptidoglycan-binding domain-containing protein [Bacteroidia bacterium]
MLTRSAIALFFLAMTLPVLAQEKKTTVQEYIDAYKDLAVSEMKRAGIPASITLAQGILESGNGNSRLAKEGNNHFGIKCKKTWTGNTIYEDDDELNECFRAYKTAKESYEDHSSFLLDNTRYAFLFDLEPTDYKGWAKGLKSAGYATNPQYAEILINLIERHELHKLDTKEGLPAKKDGTITEPKPDPLTMAEAEVFKFNKIPATKIKEGQTASSVAKAFHLRPSQIYRYNDLKEGSDLATGSIIYLKPKKRKGTEAYHTVKEGETMYSISQLYGIKLKHLYKKNRMEPGTEPATGQVVYMRRKRRTAPELRKAGDVLVKVPLADTLKTVPYKEHPPVTIAPDDKAGRKTLPKEEPKTVTVPETHPPAGGTALVITEQKEPEVFVEKTGDKKYNVEIDEVTKVDDRKMLDKSEYHVVEKGETLFSISKKYGKSVDQLKELNHLKDFGLRVGQKLIINKNYTEKKPDVETTSFYHEVKKGETLYAIAKKYNTSVDELKKLNNLTTDGVSVGTKLMVSKAAKGAAETEATVNTKQEYHIVQVGETLFAISKKYGVSVDEIKKLNSLADAGIKVGDKLRVK